MKGKYKRLTYALGMAIFRAIFIFGLGSIVILFMYIQYYRTHPDAISVSFFTVMFAGFFEAAKEGLAIIYTLGLYFSIPLYINTVVKKRIFGTVSAFIGSLLPSLLFMLAVGFIDIFLIAGGIMKMDGVFHYLGSAVHIAIEYGILLCALFLVVFGLYPNEMKSNSKKGYYNAFEEDYRRGEEFHKTHDEGTDYQKEYRNTFSDRQVFDNKTQSPSRIPLEELLTYPAEKMREVKGIFAGCTESSSKAKYKALSRKFHPDSAEGDKDAMINIDTQYKSYRERFKRSEKGSGHAQT